LLHHSELPSNLLVIPQLTLNGGGLSVANKSNCLFADYFCTPLNLHGSA